MLVYRITLARYADALIASGNPARWNSKDVKVIYTAGSRSLACLENVVHRNSRGLQGRFRTLLIEIPDQLKITELSEKKLPVKWSRYEQMPLTQTIGDNWVKENKTAILKVPSVIVPQEFNYILNVEHKDFHKIRLLVTEPFEFDARIKQ